MFKSNKKWNLLKKNWKSVIYKSVYCFNKKKTTEKFIIIKIIKIIKSWKLIIKFIEKLIKQLNKIIFKYNGFSKVNKLLSYLSEYLKNLKIIK